MSTDYDTSGFVPLGDFAYLTKGHLEVVLRNYVERWRGQEPYRLIHLVEGALTGEINGIPVEGLPDLIVEDNGTPLVMDHKWTTGWLGSRLHTRVKHEKQLRLYALLAREAFGLDIRGGVCNAGFMGEAAAKTSSKAAKFDRYRFTFSLEELEETKRWVEQMVREMEWRLPESSEDADINLFPQSPSAACGWCEFEELCSSPPPLRRIRIATNYQQRELRGTTEREGEGDA
jgi:hypothetical protein